MLKFQRKVSQRLLVTSNTASLKLSSHTQIKTYKKQVSKYAAGNLSAPNSHKFKINVFMNLMQRRITFLMALGVSFGSESIIYRKGTESREYRKKWQCPINRWSPQKENEKSFLTLTKERKRAVRNIIPFGTIYGIAVAAKGVSEGKKRRVLNVGEAREPKA